MADLYLGERVVALCTGVGATAGTALPSLEHRDTEGIDDALQQLTGLLDSLPRRAEVRLWLGGGLCRPFLVEAVPDLRNEGELLRAAMVLARQQANFLGPVKLWMEPPRSTGSSRVAVAALADWVDGALASCAAVRRRVRCLRPWWASVLNGHIVRSSAWSAMGVIDSDAMIAFAGSQGDFDVVESLRPRLDDASARAYLARTLIEFDGGSAPASLFRLDMASRADVPLPGAFGHWVHRVA